MIYVLFPILAAVCYGLAFAATERALTLTSASTYLLLSAIPGFIFVAGLIAVKGEKLSWAFLENRGDVIIVAVAAIAPALGWLFTTYAIKNVNASYAAFAEISYPLFTLLFLFLFFGIKHFDWYVLVGGAFVMTGSFLLVFGQLSQSP